MNLSDMLWSRLSYLRSSRMQPDPRLTPSLERERERAREKEHQDTKCMSCLFCSGTKSFRFQRTKKSLMFGDSEQTNSFFNSDSNVDRHTELSISCLLSIRHQTLQVGTGSTCSLSTGSGSRIRMCFRRRRKLL